MKILNISESFSRGSLGTLFLQKGWAPAERWGVKNESLICDIDFSSINLRKNCCYSFKFDCECLEDTEVYLNGELQEKWHPSNSIKSIHAIDKTVGFNKSLSFQFHVKKPASLLMRSFSIEWKKINQSPNLLEADKRLSSLPNNLKPIFITGIPRSGTTLLYNILCECFNIRSKLIESFFFIALYSNFKVKYQNDCVNAFIGKKQSIKFNEIKKLYFKKISHDNLLNLIRFYYRCASEYYSGIVIDKTPDHIHYSSAIIDAFHDAKIIFCTRPANEVFASFKKRLQYEKNQNNLNTSDWLNVSITDFISKYEDSHFSALDVLAKKPNNIFVLDYDAFISMERNILNRLADFLDLSIEKLESSLFISKSYDERVGLLSGGLQYNQIKIEKYLSKDEKKLLDHINCNVNINKISLNYKNLLIEEVSFGVPGSGYNPYVEIPKRARLNIRYKIHAAKPDPDLSIGIGITNAQGALLFSTKSHIRNKCLQPDNPGQYFYAFFNFNQNFPLGEYNVTAFLHKGVVNTEGFYHRVENSAKFLVVPSAIPIVSTNQAVGVEFGISPHLEMPILPKSVPKSVGLKVAHGPLLAANRHLWVLIENNSLHWLSSCGQFPVHISYSAFDKNESLLVADGLRSQLNPPLEPSGKRIYPLYISPDLPIDCILRVSLVQEHIFWFSEFNPYHADTIAEMQNS